MNLQLQRVVRLELPTYLPTYLPTAEKGHQFDKWELYNYITVLNWQLHQQSPRVMRIIFLLDPTLANGSTKDEVVLQLMIHDSNRRE